MPETSGTLDRISRLLFGRPLATAEAPHEVVTKTTGLAVFASDALSSVAYATQEILLVLAVAGTAALTLSIPIAVAIIALLIILTISYRQTIFAYPSGGGAYIVAHDNLGDLAATVAAASLLTDYVLTVSVSISSGVAQIVSAFPALYAYRVEIAVAIVAFMTIVNLRGVRESGLVFSLPTYLFIGLALLMIASGLVQFATGRLGQVTGVDIARQGVAPLTLFLILRAFSSGCTALTGVEAISNGIPAFKEPRTRNAATTLLAMSGILVALFLGITILARWTGALPSDRETVISQLARTIHGPGALYLLTLASTTLILIMAANTSYADFPRLGALVARDGFLPRQLSFRGSRLVYTYGIVTLAILAGGLIALFRADTSALIPLYAIGVFLSFTLSQSGMVVRWRRIGRLRPGEQAGDPASPLRFDPRWGLKQFLSGLGAFATAVVTVIFAVTKFSQGAWVVILLIPLLVFIFFRIHHHYQRVAQLLSLDEQRPQIHSESVITILLVDEVHSGTVREVSFVESLGCPWYAVHIAADEDKARQTRAHWDRYIGQGQLIVLPSPYRRRTEPLRDWVIQTRAQNPKGFIHVVLGQLVAGSYWEQALHRNSNMFFNLALRDIPDVVVTYVSYQVSEDHEHPNGHD